MFDGSPAPHAGGRIIRSTFKPMTTEDANIDWNERKRVSNTPKQERLPNETWAEYETRASEQAAQTLEHMKNIIDEGNARKQGEDIGLGTRFGQAFPYESFCCNGDYCKADCDGKMREALLAFIAFEITKAQVEVLSEVRHTLWATLEANEEEVAQGGAKYIEDKIVQMIDRITSSSPNKV